MPCIVNYCFHSKICINMDTHMSYRYHKLRKAVSKFYRRHYELISKFNVGLKSRPIRTRFYVYLVYKFKTIMGRTDFSDQFRKIIIRNKRIGCDLNIMQQSACLMVNPITVDNLMHSLIVRWWIGRQTL